MESSTDKSSKLNCDYREHQDYAIPAKCQKFIDLTGISTQFNPSECEYCIKTKPELILSNDPFRSKYCKLLNSNIAKPLETLEYANCVLLGDPISTVDPLPISEYLKANNTCHYYKTCTITPTNIRNCQLCQDRLNIKYEFNKNPDYNIYETKPKFGQIKKWAVGITTAHRKYQTITKTVKALEHAGWDTGTIFAEPHSYIDCGPNWQYVHRANQIGIFGNWILGLYELFIRNIDADAFFIIQDDIIISPNAREYLEKVLWFTEQPHLISLFGPNAIDNNENNGWRSTTTYHGGPNSIVMSHETVQKILSSLIPLQYYGIQKQKKTSFDDLGIFALMSMNKWPTFYPKPSIGDHIGHQSTHCTQTTKWVYSDRVLCNHQYYDVEHWFITDNTSNADTSSLQRNLDKFNDINWLIITKDINPRNYLQSKCKSDWIITTELPIGTELLFDIRDEIIKHFIYSHRWLKFGFGIINNQYVYTTRGPCKTLCERTENLQTCLSPELSEHDCRIIKEKAFWISNATM